MKLDPPLLVLVEWEDTRVVDDDTWTHRAGAKAAAPEVFQQVGWLLERDARQIVLTATLSHDLMSQRDCIPTAVVRSIVAFDTAFGQALPALKRKRK